MSSRLFQVLGVTVVAGGGYYLYSAGGDPKVAEKKLESDAAHLSSKVKNELPGSFKDAKTDAKVTAERAGSKIDSAYDQAKAQGKDLSKQLSSYEKDAEKKLEQARKETGSKLSGAVDKFDNTVEQKASEAKSGISGWFGGK